MKLAKDFDPQCLRQLIGAPKIDKDDNIAEKLLDRGPGAMELKLYCIAVVNRNQDEINENITLKEMKKCETDFFLKHPEAFQYLPDEFKGIDQLVKKLAIIQITKKNREKTLQLKNIPIPLTSEQDCWMKFQSMINAFRESIRTKVNGDYDILTRVNMITNSNQISAESIDSKMLSSCKTNENLMDSMLGDDRLAYHIYRFQRNFQDELTKTFSDFFSSDYYKFVLHAIDDGAGVSLPNFPSYQMSERLFHGELQRVSRTCFALMARISEYLKERLLRIFHQVFDIQYIRLVEQLKDVIIKQIDLAADRATERIQEILDMKYRIFIINNLYPDKVVRKRIIDTISQICYHQFIIKCTLDIDRASTIACSSSDLLRFMKEPTEQTSRRDNLVRTIKAYEDALRLGQGYL
ncbi:unnamed protein product [Rotaria magnacalcarata]|nr:unnamed protein product [Rotaria magnacalcarata]